MHRIVAGSFAFLVAVVACEGPPPADGSVRDGGECERHRECKSGTCGLGVCEGSGCTMSDPNSCSPGWTCVDFPGGFLTAGSIRCVPLCGECPPDSHCPFDDQASGARCERGVPRKITIQAPDKVKVGEPVRVSVTAEPPMSATATADWQVHEKPASKGRTWRSSTVGEVFEEPLDVNVAGDYFLTVYLSGLTPQQLSESAEGMKPIRVECLGEGEICKEDTDSTSERERCCAAGLFCKGEEMGSHLPRACARLE